MKRFRLKTLMILVAIAALCAALAVQYVQHEHARRRYAELQARFSRALMEPDPQPSGGNSLGLRAPSAH